MIENMHIRISRGNVRKLEKLLHMRYKPSEIAQELGITTDTIYRSYLPAGAPCERDSKGHVWIVGDVFAKWAVECLITNKRLGAKIKLIPGQGYCLRCNQVIDIQRPRKSKPNARGVLNLSGWCPVCSGRVNRLMSARDLGGLRHD